MARKGKARGQQDFADDPGRQLAAAEELVSRAYEAEDLERRVRLAREAIEICPDCAEAFVCLAELAPTVQDAEAVYRFGVAAGESALGGADRLAAYAGHFWSLPETRPYLRARFGLAQTLWAAGKQEAALDECRELLRLNPRDNQGVRYLLSSYYGNLMRDDAWQELLERYAEDDTGEWRFNRALLAFRRQGDSSEACQRLHEAHAGNAHVAAYLLGHRFFPDEMPDQIVLGGESEAIAYAMRYLAAWRATSGAVGWVRRTLRIPFEERTPARRPSLRRLIAGLADLPQGEDEVWEVDVRRSRLGCPSDLEGSPPWTLIATRPETNDLLVLETFGDQQPAAREVLARFLEAMQQPRESQWHRPELILVRRKTLADKWRPHLETLDIECELVEELEHIDFVLERLENVTCASTYSTEDLEQHLAEMADLPREPGEVWQADVRRLAYWVTEDGLPHRPSGALVAGCADNVILAQRVGLFEPEVDLLLSAVVSAIRSPLIGEPHLPGAIEVGSEEACRSLQRYLEAVGVECRFIAELELLDAIYGELEQSLASPHELTALIDTPGVTLRHVAGFFAAAADFYRRQPWRHAPSDLPIRIQCSRFHHNTWYAVVMGQLGMTLGLAMYEDLELLRSILRQEGDTDRRQAGISVMFGEAFEISVRDLDAAEKHGWPVAGPEAYPLILRVNPGMAVRPPLAWELELTEACLRAIPDFLQRPSGGEFRVTVPTSTGELELALNWQPPAVDETL